MFLCGLSKAFLAVTMPGNKVLELGGSRMERKSLWRNFLVLTVGSLLALHLNVSQASDSGSNSSPDATDECVLEE
jgi:hypothetical protein